MTGGGPQAKVLTVGPPCGRIKELISKVTAINTKYGPFAVLLVLGDLFKPYVEGAELSAEEQGLLRGSLQSPIPIHFALPPSPLHPEVRAALVSTGKLTDDETAADTDDAPPAIKVADGLFYLGKAGVKTIPAGSTGGQGLRIAVAGGRWDAQHWQNSVGREESVLEGVMNPYMTSASIHRLLSHPSLQEPVVVHQSVIASEQDEPPTSLAAARAQMAKRSAALQKQADQASKPPIDILLTTSWPSGITMFSDTDKLPHTTSRVWGAPVVAQLARNAQPRYHFALAPGSCGEAESEDAGDALGIVGLDDTEEGRMLRRTGAFWEREPYRSEGVVHPLCNVTRFISLARLANEKKQRWFMALNLAPAHSQSREVNVNLPAGATISPFSVSGFGGPSAATLGDSTLKRKDTKSGDIHSGPNYRWTENPRARKQARGGSEATGLPSKPDAPMPAALAKMVVPVGPQDCWFCLSNPQCAKHLIVAIGTECYVAMPKGQLPPTSHPLSPVPGGGHVLIVPIEHFPSLLGHADAAAARAVSAEMAQWRTALRKAFASFDAVPVGWEICRTTGTRAGHMQAQVVPIPRAMYEDRSGSDANGNVGLETFFRQAAVKYEYELIDDPTDVQRLLSLQDTAAGERDAPTDYFRLDLDDKTLLMPLQSGRRFNLQFPRETLAAFLGVPDRTDWKRCARSDAIETAEAKVFKSAFEEYAEQVTADDDS